MLIKDEGLGLTSSLLPEALGQLPVLNGSWVHGGRVGASPSAVLVERWSQVD